MHADTYDNALTTRRVLHRHTDSHGVPPFGYINVACLRAETARAVLYRSLHNIDLRVL